MDLKSRPGSYITSDNFGNTNIRINPLKGDEISNSYNFIRDVTSSQDLGTQAKINVNKAVDYIGHNPVGFGLKLAGVTAFGYKAAQHMLKRNNESK